MYGLPSSLRHARYMLTPRERNSSTSSGVMPRTLPRHVSLLSDTGTSPHKRRRRIFIVAPGVTVDPVIIDAHNHVLAAGLYPGYERFIKEMTMGYFQSHGSLPEDRDPQDDDW